jgi:hypothetical protein
MGDETKGESPIARKSVHKLTAPVVDPLVVAWDQPDADSAV